MSADIYISKPACDHCGRSGDDDQNFNLTYNLSPMLWGAGMPEWSTFEGMPVQDAGPIWDAVADELEANPSRYVPMNPPNGWGDYDGALRTMRALARACEEAPAGSVITTWL